MVRHSLPIKVFATELFMKNQCDYNAFIQKWSDLNMQIPPSRSTLYRLVKKFTTTGDMKNQKQTGRKTVRDDTLIASIGVFIYLHPFASLNNIVEEFQNISRTTVWRILRINLKWKPYRPRRVHRLIQGDDVNRYWCLDALLSKLNNDPSFISKIVWSDECAFKLNGTIATNNVVRWSEKNPHYTFERSTNRAGVMVFAAISVVGVVCIAFFDEMPSNENKKKKNSVNKKSYTEMIETHLLPELASLFPACEFENIFFMQDGAAPHNIPDTLNRHFGMNWLGNASHRAPIIWPSRSPDLTPMGNFFCI